MVRLPRNLYTASQVRELDRQAIEVCGIPGLVLMERAGAAAFEVLEAIWPDAWRIVVVCGTGNNGGDGYVVARLAQENDKNVRLLQVGDHSKLKGDAKSSALKAHEAGVHSEPFAADKLEHADLIIDALLGTGLDRDVTGDYLEAVKAINEAPAPVLAIDIPSGLNADTGRILGSAVEADATISFIGLKQGLLTGDGPACSGRVCFNDLDVPDEIYDAVHVSSCRIDLLTQKPLLGKRKATAHKGDFGHALIVGGDQGFAGAARMAAEAAARSGSGLTSLATRQQHATQIIMTRPEIMAHGVENCGELTHLLRRINVVGIGPGLCQGEWGTTMFRTLLETSLPLVVDADALNLIAQEPVQRENWILTPHPGEAARLLGCTVTEVQSDRFTAIRELQKRYGGVVVLKGAGTLILSDQGCISLCDQGNPGMATGGMGDVLTGVITGLVAQGLDLLDAAKTGVCIHANAGDLAVQQGERGMLAMDLMPAIRQLVNP